MRLSVAQEVCSDMKPVNYFGKDNTFELCEGTREISTTVTYSTCDGFSNVCLATPLSVRLSQALAYSSSWMGVLSFTYTFAVTKIDEQFIKTRPSDAVEQATLPPETLPV